MKKILTVALLLCLMASLALPALADTPWGTSIMYVKTANGKPVNVRSAPYKGDNVIGSAPYGHEVLVDWSYAGNDGWTKVVWGSMGDGYIMSQFLVNEKPGPAPSPSQKDKEKEAATTDQAKLEQELKSEKPVSEYFYIAVRPTRVSGWINFRTGPSATTTRISSFPQDKELLVLGETTNWYRARDPETDKVGYIHKSYTTKLAKKYVTEVETPDGIEKLGTLNVNGEFNLTCRMMEGYSLQVVNLRGNQIVASILSDDMTKPQLYLSIAYDDSYSNVERMNDLSADELALLEDSFKDMDEVEISYRETGHGTKLLIAREIGGDTDFVDILSIYQGYFIEFNMTPNPKTVNQTLTEEQIQMCIDFLTDLDFVPAK